MGKYKYIIFILALALLPAMILFRIPRSEVEEPEHIIDIGAIEYANITVLIDNNAFNGLRSPWGISIYVETPNITILFDTGPRPEDLEYNCRLLKVDLSKVDIVVLSHEHGDHIGGLGYLASQALNATVYVPSGMSNFVKNEIRKLNFKLIEVEQTTIISEGIAVVGQLYGPPYEQALALNIKNLGLVVIVGCSHPGVDKIVHKIALETGEKPYLVLGGFHMAAASKNKITSVILNLVAYGVNYIAPIHCSGDNFRKIMSKDFRDKYLELHVGSRLIVNSTGVYLRG